MGQKVNPHGLRVGVIKDWDSKWFAGKKEFQVLLKVYSTCLFFSALFGRKTAMLRNAKSVC